MADKVKSYRDLRVWQDSVELSVMIYQITEQFPKTEQYGLSNQMRRAGVSITSNIAEGFGRTPREFARFLEMSLGSLAELETQMEIALRVGYVGETIPTGVVDKMNSLGRQLNVFHQKVRQSCG
ncbi:MAG: four helix bundle protein [Chloroflexi bacterium]|nr:four helix bundle protein [Chloroflexota bacterium]